MRTLLEIRDLDVFYGDAQALSGVSLDVPENAIVAIVGANGAGKSTLIRAVAGIERARAGRISFAGRDLAGLESHEICNLGIGHVAEGRQLFPGLTTLEKLRRSYASPQPDHYYRTGPLQLWVLDGLLGHAALHEITRSLARSPGPHAGLFAQFEHHTRLLAEGGR